MDKAILVLNAGSSSIKFGIFAPGKGGVHVNENLRDMKSTAAAMPMSMASTNRRSTTGCGRIDRPAGGAVDLLNDGRFI